MSEDPLEILQAQRERRVPCALATVVETRGSVSARSASKALIGRDGQLLAGWVGGGCAEALVREAALASLASGESRVVEIDLEDEVLGAGMPCGGHMRVFVEPFLPRPMLWILGDGRIAETLGALADGMGLDVTVHAPRATVERFPGAWRLITEDPRYQELRPSDADFVVIATQHKGDYRALEHLLGSPVRYIALIASKRRARRILQRLQAEGHADMDLARVRSPAGLDLGARTPEEIALSVIAEVVAQRRGGSGCALTLALEGRATAESLRLANK
jgi:xanthine dehydrogenase accessory factor